MPITNRSLAAIATLLLASGGLSACSVAGGAEGDSDNVIVIGYQSKTINTVTAGTLLRDLALFPDRLDPSSTVDDMLITLLPGESVTFRVDTAERLDPEVLTAPPVLRCVNDLVSRR